MDTAEPLHWHSDSIRYRPLSKLGFIHSTVSKELDNVAHKSTLCVVQALHYALCQTQPQRGQTPTIITALCSESLDTSAVHQLS